MKQNHLSILYPYQDRVEYHEISEEAWHDLGFDAMIMKVVKLPGEAALLKRVMTHMTPDPEVCRFRCDVFDDLLNHPAIRVRLSELLEKVKSFYDYSVIDRRAGEESGIWDLLHRLEAYHDYIVTVEEIQDCLSSEELVSEGLRQLKSAIQSIYHDHAFEALRRDVSELRCSASAVKSLTVGINVNDRFEAVSMGLVSVNAKPFARSGVLRHFAASLSPRDDIHADTEWNGGLCFHPASPSSPGDSLQGFVSRTAALRNPLLGFTLAAIPGDDGSARVTRQLDHASSMLVSRLVKHLKEVLAKYVNISVRDIANLIPELLFYVRWADYLNQVQSLGWVFCKPQALSEASPSEESMRAVGLYNLKLIDAVSPDRVVRNDLVFEGRTRAFILTGANRGGKTTFTQAVGQLFVLAQAGISVPASSFSFVPADMVLTHFPADEDKTLDLGRLGEECRRFREIYQACSSSSLLLLNETFSTTSFEEGYYIAVDAVKAILKKRIRLIYNTHMHKLALDLDEVMNPPESDPSSGRAVSLIVETKDGQSSFRVKRSPPEGKSYAETIARKYGVTYEELTSEIPGGAGSPSDES